MVSQSLAFSHLKSPFFGTIVQLIILQSITHQFSISTSAFSGRCCGAAIKTGARWLKVNDFKTEVNLSGYFNCFGYRWVIRLPTGVGNSSWMIPTMAWTSGLIVHPIWYNGASWTVYIHCAPGRRVDLLVAFTLWEFADRESSINWNNCTRPKCIHKMGCSQFQHQWKRIFVVARTCSCEI